MQMYDTMSVFRQILDGPVIGASAPPSDERIVCRCAVSSDCLPRFGSLHGGHAVDILFPLDRHAEEPRTAGKHGPSICLRSEGRPPRRSSSSRWPSLHWSIPNSSTKGWQSGHRTGLASSQHVGTMMIQECKGSRRWYKGSRLDVESLGWFGEAFRKSLTLW